jgi:hypothetical protein
MRFIITEEEKTRMRKLHLEQSSLDANRYNTIYSDPQKAQKFNRELRDLASSLTIDDTIDVISGLIDGIPGIGQVVSAGIDVTHASAYAVRFFFEEDEDKKVEYACLAILTFATSSLPMAGNSINIVARQGIKRIIRHTPVEILLMAKRLGIYEKTLILLSKSGWKYNFFLAMSRIVGSEIIEVIPAIINKIRLLKSKVRVKEIQKGLNELEMLLQESKQYFDVVRPIAGNLT